ncbi:MAG: transketolase family protein, partial [Thermomicrobiales bacterium]
MRTVFLRALTDLGAADHRVVLITGDLGFKAIEPFAAACPGRFFNAGVAEQDVIGIATGLAEAGFIPFCYSIAPFAALRPCEFIRNGPVKHGWPVRVIGVGGGFDYGHAGS